jgi:hypothetical protein
MVRAIVGCERVFLAVDRKFAFSNTVGEASNGCSKMRMLLEVAVKRWKAGVDVGSLAIAIRDVDSRDDRTKIDQLDAVALAIGQYKSRHRLAIRSLPESDTINLHIRIASSHCERIQN